MRRLGLVGCVALAACNSGGAGGVTAMHELHQTVAVNAPTLTADFYALPFPNDVRMDPDGTIGLALYPRVGGLLEQYVDVIDQKTTGFGTNSAVYFRFDGAIDPASLPVDAMGNPDPHASIADSSTAFVVDVTPGSPTFGKRSPVLAHFVTDGGEFIGPNWLALLPFAGVPLREKTTYAAVLTDGVRAVGGAPVKRARDFESAIAANAAQSSDPAVARAAAAYAPFINWAAGQAGLLDHTVNATVFTTLDATSVMARLRAAVYANAPAPVLADLTAKEAGATWQVYEGSYLSPNFQSGLPPYMTLGDGQIEYDASGVPQIQRTETLRTAMTIPLGTMPQAGWPVVLYAHGTGGNYRSFIQDQSGPRISSVTMPDGSTVQLAMISIDQVLHGPRDPADPNNADVELNFFNFPNPAAGVDNVKQGALDDFQLLRLVKSVDVAAAPTTGAPIKFDPTKIYFMGHSQGGLTGPLFLGAEPEVKAAVLSGAGAVLIFSLLNKTEPVNIPQVVGALFQDPVDQYHPMLSLVQNFFEPSEPANYARLFFREPPAGFGEKSIFQTLGLIDHYAPVPDIKALALAMEVQPINPMLDPIDGLDLVGQSWGTAPVSGNVGGGGATGVLLEYKQLPSSDGHFVLFDITAAWTQANRFLASHATTGVARLDPP